MPYTSQSILTDRFGAQLLIRLTDRAEIATGVIDSDVVDRALTDTDAMINGYLAARYKLPLASTPPQVQDLASVIAIYKLHVYAAETKIEQDYRDALKMLIEISKGVVRLPVEGIEPEGTGGSGAQFTDRDRPFEASKMTGFI